MVGQKQDHENLEEREGNEESYTEGRKGRKIKEKMRHG